MSATITEHVTLVEQTQTAEPLRMSYEEYVLLDDEGVITEWVNGEVITLMPPMHEHQTLAEFLDRLIGLFVQIYKLGLVRIAPFTMRVQPGGNAREPDLFFVATENLERLERRELSGPADLAVEIISDDSVARDRTDKFYEYQSGGVREYWLIDPRPGMQRVDLYTLDETRRYRAILPDTGGKYHSVVLPGFYLREAWLWADEPNPLAALVEVVGVERMLQAIRQ